MQGAVTSPPVPPDVTTPSCWAQPQRVSGPRGWPAGAVAAIVPLHCPAHGEASTFSAKDPLGVWRFPPEELVDS